VVAGGLLGPILPLFQAQSPDIALDIIADPSIYGPGAAPRVMNALRDVDIALRLARPTQGDMLVRKLTDVAYGLYAPASYAKKLGDLPARNDLTDIRIIGFSEDERPLGPVWWLSRAEKAGHVVMRSSSAATRLAACLNGDAVAALPCFQANNMDGLVRVAGPDLVGSLELWLLTRADMTKLGHVRAVMDFVVDAIAGQSARLGGL
jgi:DNA-binding transcriptional LysR family regulator